MYVCRRVYQCTLHNLFDLLVCQYYCVQFWVCGYNICEEIINNIEEMATAKGTENEYSQRKAEKASESTVSRRTQKLKATEPVSSEKKQTRAKTRTAQSDDIAPTQSSVNKAREKARAIGDSIKEEDGIGSSKKDTENTTPPKKEVETVAPPKKDVGGIAVPKKEIIIPLKKEIIASGSPKKDGESAVSPKKDMQPLTASKKDVTSAKSRKVKVKLSSTAVPEKKLREDSKSNSSKVDDVKSEVSTTEKTKNKDEKVKIDRKENGTAGKSEEKNREIMNSDVTSSVDDKTSIKIVRNHSPASGANTKDGWSPGDLAWGRVGQHPFWPCMIAIDHQTGQFTKTKRVGRGLNSVQQSLHVQFFGDNGRHSWIPTTCVIKYEGKEQFQKFADKVLHEMKKKDKKYSSAFIVKPSSKTKWEIAIREAEATVPKAREERIKFFQDLLPKKKATEKADTKQKDNAEEVKSVQLVKKTKRPSPSSDEKPAKQAKVERQVVLKAAEEKKKLENATQNSPTRKKRGRNKIIKKQTGNAAK